MKNSKRVEKAQAVYSKNFLSFYDLFILGVSSKHIWKCPCAELVDHYDENISSNHLDIGVGTGYFLDRCRFPSNKVRVALMDLNQNCLDKTKKRINRYNPQTYCLNALEKVEIDAKPFDSIALNYLFHCLPGKLSKKLVVLDNVDHLLSESGTVFGSTILSRGVEKSRIAVKLMDIYNKKGIFNNSEDSYEDLERFLSMKYSNHQITTRGCVALFKASK